MGAKQPNSIRPDFIEWVKYIRQHVFTSSQQQFSELLERQLKQGGKSLGRKQKQKKEGEGDQKRYIGMLEGRASTIQIDVLEQMLKMIGVDFREQKQFYEIAFKVADSAVKKSKKIELVDFTQLRHSLNTVQEPDFISSLDSSIKYYIYNNLVKLDKKFYGTNRLVDMQSINYFWTVVMVEYYIKTQGDSALSEATSDMIQEKLKKVLIPVVDKCEEIFERTASKRIAEGKSKFNEIKNLITNIDITFTTPKSKREQLEYKINLRTQRITECVNLVLSNYLDKMLELLRKISDSKVNFLLACLSSWSTDILNLIDSFNQLLQTGNTDNEDMYSGYKRAVSNNHIELIYDMSIRINMFEQGKEAIGFLAYLLPEYDDNLIAYLEKHESEETRYKEWRNELTTILSDCNWRDKYAGPYTDLKNSIVNFLYSNNISINAH